MIEEKCDYGHVAEWLDKLYEYNKTHNNKMISKLLDPLYITFSNIPYDVVHDKFHDFVMDSDQTEYIDRLLFSDKVFESLIKRECTEHAVKKQLTLIETVLDSISSDELSDSSTATKIFNCYTITNDLEEMNDFSEDFLKKVGTKLVTAISKSDTRHFQFSVTSYNKLARYIAIDINNKGYFFILTKSLGFNS